ncbi:SUMF1/EgtB/PvdO family nonheme iron enzyme [Myxococcota bacterium]|nr:SUMF1/EgtB/PvdO family nonheme iron enzyme [Myxococcota bacterium]
MSGRWPPGDDGRSPRRPEVVALATATGIDLDGAARVLAWLDRNGHLAPLPSTSASASLSSSADLPDLLLPPLPLDHDPEHSLGVTYIFDQAEAPDVVEVTPPDPAERYEDRGLLGRGGMGEVRRVFDRQLGRTVAMKILRPDARASVRRFLQEARVIAGLQHPGVLPVHEIGRLPDGRVYFTMQEIHGRTLREHIREVHQAAGDHWRATPDGWTFRRLVSSFHAACEAVAFAHGEGLVHRDLKPHNVMIGAHGEVLVVDWGLARPAGTPVPPDRIVGTPAYLAPELLRSERPPVDPRADVYALGAVLFVILTNHAPFHGSDPQAVIEAVRQGPSPVPEHELPLPDELVEICVRAMARDPHQRIGHAGVLAAAVRTWLDGAHKREEAQALVDQARQSLPEAAALRFRAAKLEAEVRDSLAALPPWAPEEDKHEAWAILDEAARLRARAEGKEDEAELVLQGALTVDPTLPEAHAELAARSMARHAEAEQQCDQAAATSALVRLRRHVDSLPPHHPARSRLRTYLRGEAALTLHSHPSGAEVRLFRLVERHRRLVPELAGTLGRTPLDAATVPHGDLLVELRLDGHAPTRLPMRASRGGHWSRVRPGEEAPLPVCLPPGEALGPEDRYVPAGWCTVGGDPVAIGSAARRRLWIDGFVLRRFPVTNRQYIAFLDDLWDRGEQELALRLAPRERGGTQGEQGPVIYGQDAQGHFTVRADIHGDLWQLDWPVVMVDWHGAVAFAAWEAARTGQPWRLPGEWEWEKAARGVDERPYPWGWHFDPSRACTRLSHPSHPQPAVVDSYPVDESIYGVRGLAGNVRDWCLDRYQELPPPDASRVRAEPAGDHPGPRINRGGFWLGNERDARAADRHFHPPEHRSAEIGFRLARSLPVEPDPT